MSVVTKTLSDKKMDFHTLSKELSSEDVREASEALGRVSGLLEDQHSLSTDELSEIISNLKNELSARKSPTEFVNCIQRTLSKAIVVAATSFPKDFENMVPGIN